MKLIWDVFITFVRVGIFTFGGGYAMLPVLQKEVVDGKGWVSAEDVLDYYAVGQCLPGIIAVNTALFIGNKVKGRACGVVAALGVAFPSLVIITVIAAFLRQAFEYPVVQKAFFGVRVVVCALIIHAVARLWKSAVKDVVGVVIFLAVLGLSLFTAVPTIVLILLSVLAGLVCARFAHIAEDK